MSEQAFIYELRDPETGHPRYVGITRHRYGRVESNLRSRLQAHTAHPSAGTPEKARWILDLKGRGTRPTIHLLESVPVEEAGAAERRWIECLRNQGENLLNQWPKPNSPPRCGPRRGLRYRLYHK